MLGAELNRARDLSVCYEHKRGPRQLTTVHKESVSSTGGLESGTKVRND